MTCASSGVTGQLKCILSVPPCENSLVVTAHQAFAVMLPSTHTTCHGLTSDTYPDQAYLAMPIQPESPAELVLGTTTLSVPWL